MKKVISTLVVGSICMSSGLAMQTTVSDAIPIHVPVVKTTALATVPVATTSLFADVECLRGKLGEYRERAILESDKETIIALQAATDIREFLGERSEEIELISNTLLEAYMEVVIQSEVSLTSTLRTNVLLSRELNRRFPAGEKIWRVPPAFRDKLDEAVLAKAEKIEDARIAPPDYSHPVIKKAYTAPAMSEAVVADANGWMFFQYRLQRLAWVSMEINGNPISTGNGEGLCYFVAVCDDFHNHYSFMFPAHRGDRFHLKGGSWHSVIFYPCIKYK